MLRAPRSSPDADLPADGWRRIATDAEMIFFDAFGREIQGIDVGMQ